MSGLVLLFTCSCIFLPIKVWFVPNNCLSVLSRIVIKEYFASRNAPECSEPSCQICSFVQMSERSVVRKITTRDILDGSAKLPFTSRSAWLATQSECLDLRRTRAHLVQGSITQTDQLHTLQHSPHTCIHKWREGTTGRYVLRP